MVEPRTFAVRAYPEKGTVVFAVRVQPRASKNEIAGVMEGALRIRLQAPAAENRANQELCEFVAELLKRPKSAVRILSGEHGRSKRLEVFGVTAAQVHALLRYDA